MATEITKKIKREGLRFAHAAEVGVFYPQNCNFYDLIDHELRCTLVEPHPKFADAIRSHFAKFPNVTCHQAAIFEKETTVELVEGSASSYLKSLPDSPGISNDAQTPEQKSSLQVRAVPFSKIDDGSIDLLSVDTEGSEWFVIQTMTSRPKVISLETHGGAYLNPYIKEIEDWMEKNRYELWFLTRTDSVYVKCGVVRLSFLQRFFNTAMALGIWSRRQRKRITNQLRSFLA